MSSYYTSPQRTPEQEKAANDAYEARRAAEKKELLEQLTMRGAMAAAIAEHLGKGWEHERQPGQDGYLQDSRDKLKGPNGEEISVNFGGYQNRDRYEFSGRFPTGPQGNVYHPHGQSFSITSANGKSADKYAREITSRLLKSYRPRLAEAFARIQKDSARLANQQNAAEELAQAVGLKGNRKEPTRYGTAESSIHFYTDGPSGSFTTYDGETFEVKMSSVSKEMALALAKMLRPQVEAHEKGRK